MQVLGRQMGLPWLLLGDVQPWHIEAIRVQLLAPSVSMTDKILVSHLELQVLE